MNDSDDPDRTYSGYRPSGPRDVLALARVATRLPGVRKGQLQPGDTVVVRTRNSFYAIGALPNGEYAVSGGWFAENGGAPIAVAINGCTWGGRAILTDMIAAPGLFLEFGNGVRTTRIQAVTVVNGRQNAHNN
jgi:hypothetical protein